MPLLYWTVRTTHRMYKKYTRAHSIQLCCCVLVNDCEPTPRPTTINMDPLAELDANHGSRYHFRIRRIQASMNNEDKCYRSTITRSTSTRLTLFTKSHVLSESRELFTIIISVWFYILSYIPKLLYNACRACFNYQQSNKTTFYVTFFEETVASIIIPMILLVFHYRLRLSLIITINLFLHTFCKQRCCRKLCERKCTSSTTKRQSRCSDTSGHPVCPIMMRPSISNSNRFMQKTVDDIAVTEI